MMSYSVKLYGKTILVDEQTGVDIDKAREIAADHVQTRMDAFGDDREALAGFGFLGAEESALDMPESGGTISLADGYSIQVTPEGASA